MQDINRNAMSDEKKEKWKTILTNPLLNPAGFLYERSKTKKEEKRLQAIADAEEAEKYQARMDSLQGQLGGGMMGAAGSSSKMIPLIIGGFILIIGVVIILVIKKKK